MKNIVKGVWLLFVVLSAAGTRASWFSADTTKPEEPKPVAFDSTKNDFDQSSNVISSYDDSASESVL